MRKGRRRSVSLMQLINNLRWIHILLLTNPACILHRKLFMEIVFEYFLILFHFLHHPDEEPSSSFSIMKIRYVAKKCAAQKQSQRNDFNWQRQWCFKRIAPTFLVIETITSEEKSDDINGSSSLTWNDDESFLLKMKNSKLKSNLWWETCGAHLEFSTILILTSCENKNHLHERVAQWEPQ